MTTPQRCECPLGNASTAEGKNGGQFYTPSCVVRCLVEMLAPYKGRIYDPACGSGGTFVQSERFVESHGGTAMRDSAKPITEALRREFREAKPHRGIISADSQKSSATTCRLMFDMALRSFPLPRPS